MRTPYLSPDPTQHLVFEVAGEGYGVPILRVREILKFAAVTKVPTAPACIRGVIDLRGEVVPVVDLAMKFGLPESVVTNRTCLIVVEAEQGGEKATLGILADSVNQVIELAPSDVLALPAFGTGVRVDYLLGLGKTGEKLVLLIDTGRILSPSELRQIGSLDEAAAKTVEGPAESSSGVVP